ncbi:hypothetical protein PH192_24700 (plasmid) [Escherichia coli]|nr:hypothetical protein [Escherichia coli]WCB44927.1 hypothetical protein PH192_24700 [Escherichia coli]
MSNKKFFMRAIGVCGLIFILSTMVAARFFGGGSKSRLTLDIPMIDVKES